MKLCLALLLAPAAAFVPPSLVGAPKTVSFGAYDDAVAEALAATQQYGFTSGEAKTARTSLTSWIDDTPPLSSSPHCSTRYSPCRCPATGSAARSSPSRVGRCALPGLPRSTNSANFGSSEGLSKHNNLTHC